MRNQDVDAFVAKLPAQQQEAIEVLRQLMEKHAPKVAEVISYNQPTWKGKKMVATLSPSSSHVTFVFSKGAAFTDSHGLLEGSGKTAKHIKVTSAAAINTAAIRDYIAQAVKLDA